MKRHVVVLLVLAVFAPTTRGLETQGQFENEGHWEWFLQPTEVQLEESPSTGENPTDRTLTVFLCEVADKRVTPRVVNIQNIFPLVICGASGDSNRRLVAFDENKQRLESDTGGSCSYPGATVQMMDLKLGVRKLKYIGVEHLTPEREKLSAKEAQEKLDKEGIVLSYPVVGEAFPYQFSSPESQTISSKQHLGQVVLIQWWATW